MRTLTPELKAHVQGGVTTLCTCITITRRDMATFCFTDHDTRVTIGSQTFLPFNSYSRTSISTSSDFEVNGLEINGIMNSDAIARIDIGSGLFDFAEVSMFLVNYNDVTMGQMSLRRGWIGEIEMNEDGTFQVEIRGLSQVFSFRRGEPYAPECPADLGDRRCNLNVDPDYWSPLTPYKAGDGVIGHIDGATGYVNAAITNDDFADESDNDLLRQPTGWVTYGNNDGRWFFASNFHGLTSPPGGPLYAALSNSFGTTDTTQLGMFQDVDLVSSGLVTDDIDTGLCRIVFKSAVAVQTDDGKVQLRLHAVNALGVTRIIWDTGLHAYAQNRWINLGTSSTLIPAGTRTIRVDFYGEKKGTDNYGASFGGCTLAFNDPNGTLDSDDQASGVMFVAQNAGVTAATEPSFSALLDATYVDGTVTWKCVKSFKDVSTVTVVTDAQSFTTTLPQEADYYDGGLLIWETGASAGRPMEVKTWDGTTIKLFQRVFYPIAVGDRFVIHPGCDKRRETCVSKFNNILNFQGFPDVPGQDAYMNSPTYS